MTENAVSGNTTSICRHCQIKVIRGPEMWMHVDGDDRYWYCRSTTVAGPTVDAEEGIVEVLTGQVPVGPPDCHGHKEVQHRDGEPPWCDRCGWNRGRPASPARQINTNPRLGEVP